ncbi:cystatin-B-like [Rana temporaria]|uniref:cystatin-B-like n=1 Tax=Rana temporaria TaxID=8407 RepID=UPI001AAC6E38|nr:cystatin-B-like [Rana temporaria]
MSDASKSPVFGGWSKPRSPTKEDQDILDKVKEQFDGRRDSPTSTFLALLVRTQKVSGGKYLFLVDIGEPKTICLFMFLPLYKEPTLENILPAMKILEEPLHL